jgi:hypothetical protein
VVFNIGLLCESLGELANRIVDLFPMIHSLNVLSFLIRLTFKVFFLRTSLSQSI